MIDRCQSAHRYGGSGIMGAVHQQHDDVNRVNRRGLSLLEVSLALALGSTLLLAVFQTFYVAARYRLQSDEQSPQGVIMANVLQDLQQDLANHSIDALGFSPTDLPQVANKSQGTVLPNLLTMRDSFQPATDWVEFEGRPDVLVTRSRACSPRFHQLPKELLPAAECMVIWWLCDGNAQQIEAWKSKSQLIRRPVQAPQEGRGLIRTLLWKDARGQEHQSSQVIHPDIRQLQFRYIDASSVQIHESLSAKHPSAIQVTLTTATDCIEHWFHLGLD